ncbi:uncharacterized protein LOC134272687 [Saccostrea cucullata]|uniref:uncharacterized protein LOC134272687 n=1 Tax=Saccostrea cuccullata TaxID=36930 RepID=UPI002ED183E7
MDHLDENSILSDSRHGFRTKRSSTINGLARNLGGKGQVYTLFYLTFKNSPHQQLAHKLIYCGIRDTTLQWITDFLTGRAQQVLLEGHTSTTAPKLTGVSQGTALRPTLFLLYINEQPEETLSDAHLFAE